MATFRIHPIDNKSISTNVAFKEYLKSNEFEPFDEELDYIPKDFQTEELEENEIEGSKITNMKEESNKNYTHVLYVNTTFRSHDIMKGYPLNLYALWYLGQKVINEVQKRVGKGVRIKHGPLTNNSIAAHVYEQDFKKLEQTPMIYTGLDPRGYFTISLLKDVKKLRVAYMSMKNKEIEAWESDNTQELSNNILIYISDVSHALYMGRELERAKHCLDEGVEYKQD